MTDPSTAGVPPVTVASLPPQPAVGGQTMPIVASSWPLASDDGESAGIAVGLPNLVAKPAGPERGAANAPREGVSAAAPSPSAEPARTAGDETWRADPLRALAELTIGLRSSRSDAALVLTRALHDGVGDRAVLWSVSFDGTRARLHAVDGEPVDRPWTPAAGVVAEVLGARQPVEMGVLDDDLTVGLVAPRGRLAEEDARDAGRVFGRFVPIMAAAAPTGLPGSPQRSEQTDGRIIGVLGVLRRPGRPPFDVSDRIVLDAAIGHYESTIAAVNADAELRSSSSAGLTPTAGGVTLGLSLLERLGEISGDFVFRHLFSGRTDYISSGVVASLGYSPEEVLADGGLLNRLVHPDDRHLLSEIVEDPTRCQRPMTIRLFRRNGQISWQYMRLTPILGSATDRTAGDGAAVLGIEGFATDVTAIKQAEAELVHQARSDVLTGLANRLAFRESVQRSIARLERHAGMSAVLFLDLDGFKKVNDSFGHAAGDDVLRQVADTLRRVIRREDLVARLGGDEFAVLLSELRTTDEGAATARRILAAFEQTPVTVNGLPADVSTGIGIAVVTDPATSPDELINRADIALYQAKRAGRGRWQVFEGSYGSLTVTQQPLDGQAHGRAGAPTASGGTAAPDSSTLASTGKAPASGEGAALRPPRHIRPSVTPPAAGPVVTDAIARSALAARDFRIHYLPEVQATTGHVVAVEALLRWQHPTLGLLPASAFIGELVGLETMHAIGDWALRESCRQVASWRERYRVPLQLWVNVVPAQIARPGFAETVLATITASGLSPRDVGLDVPEASLPSLTEQAEEALTTLDRAGVRLAIDDFGGGTTSLRTLQRLPLTQIKLDRALIETLDRPNGTGSADLVGMAVSLAGSLGAEVVAVGVERRTQLAQVQALQCAYVQGYLAGHALSADDIEAILRTGQPTLPGLDPLHT